MLEMLRSRNRVVWPTVTTLVALFPFLWILQTDVSGSHHPHATGAELQTLTLASTVATLIFAVRFRRGENSRNLTLLPSRNEGLVRKAIST